MSMNDERLGDHFTGGGYGEWKYDAADLRMRAEALALCLPRFMAELDADFIAIRGTSGTFMVGALQCFLPVPILLMRKSEETYHGNRMEGYQHHEYKRGIILDDFVSTGSTVRGMIEDAEKYDLDIKFVAVLEHEGCAGKGANSPRLRGANYSDCGLPVYNYRC